ncbi:MAG: DUF2069 domain-containing protein [Xanthomonadales bacterium]|nr:DUF2069 domain-containing protein [Xanthomonadales bacterium]
MKPRTAAAGALALQGAALLAWAIGDPPSVALAVALVLVALPLALCAVALGLGWPRAPFATALASLPPFVLGVSEAWADAGARAAALALAAIALAGVLAIGLAARHSGGHR